MFPTTLCRHYRALILVRDQDRVAIRRRYFRWEEGVFAFVAHANVGGIEWLQQKGQEWAVLRNGQVRSFACVVS
jgi:hypothetical protein